MTSEDLHTWHAPAQRRPDRIALLVLAWTAALFLAFLASALVRFDFFAGSYNASAYWVTYEEGFIRRGLVGAALELLLGGPPGTLTATIVGTLIFMVGCVALVLLLRLVLKAVVRDGDRLYAATVLIASPFTFSLAVQTRGRYDALIVAALVLVTALAVMRPDSANRVARALTMAAVTLAAVGTEEVAFPFLAVLVLLGLHRLGWSGGRLVLVGGLTLAPAFAVTVASYAVRPDVGYLATATERAAQAGIKVDASQENSISALGQSGVDALASSAGMSPLTIAVCFLVLGGCYVLSALVLWACTGRAAPRLTFLVLAAFAAAAVLLCVVGNDYRRWWGIAFVAAAASVVLLATGRPAPPPHRSGGTGSRKVAGGVAAGLLVVSAGAQLFPLWPTWDPGAYTNISIDHISRTDAER